MKSSKKFIFLFVAISLTSVSALADGAGQNAKPKDCYSGSDKAMVVKGDEAEAKDGGTKSGTAADKAPAAKPKQP